MKNRLSHSNGRRRAAALKAPAGVWDATILRGVGGTDARGKGWHTRIVIPTQPDALSLVCPKRIAGGLRHLGSIEHGPSRSELLRKIPAPLIP